MARKFQWQFECLSETPYSLSIDVKDNFLKSIFKAKLNTFLYDFH